MRGARPNEGEGCGGTCDAREDKTKKAATRSWVRAVSRALRLHCNVGAASACVPVVRFHGRVRMHVHRDAWCAPALASASASPMVSKGPSST